MTLRSCNILSIALFVALCFFSNKIVVLGFVAPSCHPSFCGIDRTADVVIVTRMSTIIDDDNNANNHFDDDHPTPNDTTEFNLDMDTMTLPLKLLGVVAIKTAKDVVNYPPMLLDKVLLESQQQQQQQYQQEDPQGEYGMMKKLPQTNPAVMFAKLLGIMVFKAIHDTLYFPKIWTERLLECQSLEECEI